MSLNANNRYDWEDVYHQAATLRELEPWLFVSGERLFKVESPYHDEAGWCMTMGGGGEVFGLLIYLGDEGYKNYFDLSQAEAGQAPPFESYMNFFNQRLLHVEFVPPNELEASDKAKHKAFKLFTSGHNRGIKARYHQPGGFPETVPDELLPFLADCLEQACRVTEAVQEDEEILWGPDDTKFQHLVRSGTEDKDGETTWRNSYIEAYQPVWRPFSPDQAELGSILEAGLAGLKKSSDTALFHLQYLVGGVKENKGMKPYRPLLATFLIPQSGFAQLPELLRYQSLQNTFAKRLCAQLQTLGFVPALIIANTRFAYELLEPIAETLKIKLSYDPVRPEFMEFFEEMERLQP